MNIAVTTEKIREMESLINIDIKEVKSPSQFTARVVLPWEREAYARAFLHWQDEMELIEQNTVINHEIHMNEVCAVKSRNDEWHRVRVEKVLYTGKGQQGSCYFVDSGERRSFLLSRLYKLPDHYQRHQVPFQVRPMKLWGLQPLTLQIEVTDVGIRVPHRPARKWDQAAEMYFSQITKECEQARVMVKRQDVRGGLEVILYLQNNGRLVNINDTLIKEKYATVLDTDQPQSTGLTAGPDAAAGRSRCETPPITDDVGASGGGRQPQQRHSDLDNSISDTDPQSPSAESFGVSTSKTEEELTELKLKQVMSKVQRFKGHKKYDSDTEALNCSQGRMRITSRPALGSRPGSSVKRQAPGTSVASPLASTRPPGPSSDGEQKTLGLLRRGADFRAIHVHSPSDSDSSSYSELQSFNLDSGGREELKPTLKVNGTPPALLAQAVAMAASSSLASVCSNTSQTDPPQSSKASSVVAVRETTCPSAKQPARAEGPAEGSWLASKSPAKASIREGKLEGVPSSSMASTSSASGVKAAGKVAVAGRGRGLMKLHSGDIIKAFQAVDRSSSPSHAAVAVIEGLNSAEKVSAEKEMAVRTPDKSAFRPVHQRMEGNSFTLTADCLTGTPRSDILHELLKNRPEAGDSRFATYSTGSDAGCPRLREVRQQCLNQKRKPQDDAGDGHCECSLLLPMNPRAIDLNDSSLGDGHTEGTCLLPVNPRAIDLNDSSLDDVTGEGHSLVSCHPPVNPRAIDLNVSSLGDGHTEGSLLIPVNPRAIDLNDSCLGDVRGDGHTEGSRLIPVNPRAIDLNVDCQESDMEQQSLANMRFLRLLGHQPGGGEEEGQLKVPLVWRPNRPMPNPLLGTMAWGMQLPQPVFDVEEIQLSSVVKQYMLKEGFNIPRSIQAHSWPAMMRGRHIVGVTPRHSGKTTAYLPPLVSELLKFPKYQALPRGMGPKALILVPSCKKADAISRYVRDMVGNLTTLRTLHIYGSDDHQVMPLLRGCDLLIATPHCLLRMLHSRYTQLDRLCHLVLDGADVLVDQFAEEVREVMDMYLQKLKEYRSLPVTRQVMMFGHSWSPAMAAFQRAYMPDPVLVFASRLEASVYGRVEQVVHMCFEKMHLATLKGVVETLMGDPDRRRIVIATASDDNLVKIVELLKSMSVYAHAVDFSASLQNIEDRVGHWQDQNGSSVLVVTDNNVTELRVTSADTVVHFDLPNSKAKFGNRLALMLDYFQDSCSQPLPQEKRGVSHLLVTDTMLDIIQSLHSFLLRSAATIPSAMARLLDGMHQGKNEDEGRPLCQQLKQFGWCQDEVRCQSRHLVLPCDVVQDHTPESWLPASGMVKVRILKVEDTSHYYAMLLEHQVPGQVRKDLQARHTALTMDLTMYLSVEKNQVPFHMKQGVGHLAAVKDSDGIFHRARVLSTVRSSLQTGTQHEVLYVDEGRKATVRPDQLLKLSPALQQVPPLAVEVFICRVRPVDRDTEWSRTSVDYVKNLLKDKDLIGNVVLRMKNTLWLDPLAEQTRLHNIRTHIISMVLRPDLLRRGYAHDNPHHVKNLYKACEGKIPIDKKLYQKYFNLPERKEIETETLRSDDEYHDVCLSVVDDPHHFFLQKFHNLTALDKMEKELQKHMAKAMPQHPLPPTPSTAASPSQPAQATPTKVTRRGSVESGVDGAKPDTTAGTTAGLKDKEAATSPATAAAPPASSRSSVEASTSSGELSGDDLFEHGCFCVAKFAEDGRWYRARVVEKVEEGWRVFFVDHGERKVVGHSDLYPIPDQFCKLPCQAIEGGLGHIAPLGEEWTVNSREHVWDLANSVLGDQKHLCAKVLSTERSEFAGATKYLVEVYDTCSWDRDMRFSQELVWAGEAAADDEDDSVTLFPKVTFNCRKLFPGVDAKVADLCAALYWSQEGNKRKLLTKLLTDVISNLTLTEGSTLGHGALKEAVKLIGYLRSWDSQSAVLSALVSCVTTSPRECARVIGRQLMLKLVFCIEQVRHPVVQEQAMSAALQLAQVDRFRPYLDQPPLTVVMMEMLMTEDPTPEVIKTACAFLAYLLTHGTCDMEEAEAEQLMLDLFKLLAETSDPDTLETLLALLAAMATRTSFHKFILREKRIEQILNLMRESPSQQCVVYGAQVCHSLCEASRRNRRILLEGGLVLIIRDLLEGGLDSAARVLCEELNEMLAVSVPQQTVLSGRRATATSSATAATAAADGSAVEMPLVKWSQNSFRVLLTVTVQGAKETDFTIRDASLHFRCESGGRKYGFDYDLFDMVEPDKCRVIIRRTEVVLSLAKKVKGMWSRLLSKKHKPAQLMPDFDRLVDSSDSDLDEPDNITLLHRGHHSLPVTHHTSGGPAEIFSSGSKSGSDNDDLGSDSEDERFEDPGRMIDPVAVMEDLINFHQGVRRSEGERVCEGEFDPTD